MGRSSLDVTFSYGGVHTSFSLEFLQTTAVGQSSATCRRHELHEVGFTSADNAELLARIDRPVQRRIRPLCDTDAGSRHRRHEAPKWTHLAEVTSVKIAWRTCGGRRGQASETYWSCRPRSSTEVPSGVKVGHEGSPGCSQSTDLHVGKVVSCWCSTGSESEHAGSIPAASTLFVVSN